jgi:dynein heavy chain, axonemal
LPLQSDKHADLVSGVVSASVFIHQSVERTSAKFHAELQRTAYVTPTSYLELLNAFSKLLEERRETLGKTRGRLAVGLDKLAGTAVAVEGMQVSHNAFLLMCWFPVSAVVVRLAF